MRATTHFGSELVIFCFEVWKRAVLRFCLLALTYNSMILTPKRFATNNTIESVTPKSCHLISSQLPAQSSKEYHNHKEYHQKISKIVSSDHPPREPTLGRSILSPSLSVFHFISIIPVTRPSRSCLGRCPLGLRFFRSTNPSHFLSS